ncbi:hypothetical protein GX50_00579 [[Emmonsia] crescens]|uniref:Uncharacterized protein n=1 Tax=[Emmonsia] crescens TaxID=73230 RepID=A0A2B7ZTM9_9EURO|nr:hypothetical protein GX50_00579 [Emmonsia crescens]
MQRLRGSGMNTVNCRGMIPKEHLITEWKAAEVALTVIDMGRSEGSQQIPMPGVDLSTLKACSRFWLVLDLFLNCLRPPLPQRDG